MYHTGKGKDARYVGRGEEVTAMTRFGEKWKGMVARLRQRSAASRPGSFSETFLTRGRFGGGEVVRRRIRVRRRLDRICVALTILLIFLTGAMFGSYAWSVTDVQLEGAEGYRTDDLMEVAGIRVGDRLWGFDASEVEGRLQQVRPLLATVEVSRTLGGKVTITVTEEQHLLWTEHYHNAYLLSADTLRVIAIASDGDTWQSMGAVYIGLPEEAWLQVGETLTYRYLTYPAEGESADAEVSSPDNKTAEESYSYVEIVQRAIYDSSLSPAVTRMELGDRYGLWFLLDGRIKVYLGDADSLEYKLTQAERVLAQQTVSTGAAVLDVSDPARVSYRAGS